MTPALSSPLVPLVSPTTPPALSCVKGVGAFHPYLSPQKLRKQISATRSRHSCGKEAQRGEVTCPRPQSTWCRGRCWEQNPSLWAPGSDRTAAPCPTAQLRGRRAPVSGREETGEQREKAKCSGLVAAPAQAAVLGKAATGRLRMIHGPGLQPPQDRASALCAQTPRAGKRETETLGSDGCSSTEPTCWAGGTSRSKSW